jgi:hypothetical protein
VLKSLALAGSAFVLLVRNAFENISTRTYSRRARFYLIYIKTVAKLILDTQPREAKPQRKFVMAEATSGTNEFVDMGRKSFDTLVKSRAGFRNIHKTSGGQRSTLTIRVNQVTANTQCRPLGQTAASRLQ